MTHILIVLSGADRWTQKDGRTRQAGFFAEEVGAPHEIFRAAGADVDFASPGGRRATMDPISRDPEVAGPDAERYAAYCDGIAAEINTPSDLAEVDVSNYDAVFVPGGHSPMEDLAIDAGMARVLREAVAGNIVVAAVCHGPAALVSTSGDDGWPFAGLRMTSITDAEEKAFGTAELAPWLLESRLRELGATFENGPLWGSYVVSDAGLVTGQNPASSAATARAVLDAINATAADGDQVTMSGHGQRGL